MPDSAFRTPAVGSSSFRAGALADKSISKGRVAPPQVSAVPRMGAVVVLRGLGVWSVGLWGFEGWFRLS